MPRAKKVKEPVVDVIEAVEEVIAGEAPAIVGTAMATPVIESNENVKVVSINGKLYNQIFNPADGTTRVEPLA